ncbi:heparin lyase I family protein [Myxococcaceae bacterium JPH2]|nr:heparin lyase I family protein [Myxococcaceae bacterium JPH2]
MKKSLLLVESLLVTAALGCGAPELVPSESTYESAGSGSVMASASAALTTQGCTQLSIVAVKASGDDGNGPGNTLDDTMTTRWSSLGKGQWIDYDLGTVQNVNGVSIAWHQGNLRASNFTVSVAPDGSNYTQIYSGKSSGKTTAAETYTFTGRSARRVRITVNGNTLNDWASIAEARACGTGTSPGTGTGTTPSTNPNLVWRGDFETGDRSQWDRTQMVSADRLQVVTSPTREGRYALQATVKQGDDPINASGNRNELVKMTREPVGSEYFYRWSNLFASNYPSAKTWQLFAQWHHEGSDGSPPVEFYVNGEEILLKVGGSGGTIVWRTPLVRNAWQDFIFHVRWSPNSTVGFVELYHNGKLVLPKRAMATQYSGMLNYLKVGLYRNDTIVPVGVVYHDGWVMGRTLQDVLNSTYKVN